MVSRIEDIRESGREAEKLGTARRDFKILLRSSKTQLSYDVNFL